MTAISDLEDRLGEEEVSCVWAQLDRMTMVMVNQTTQRVPPVPLVDVNAVQYAGLLMFRKYVVMANLLVVPETKGQMVFDIDIGTLITRTLAKSTGDEYKTAQELIRK